jgi:hypothetical protein
MNDRRVPGEKERSRLLLGALHVLSGSSAITLKKIKHKRGCGTDILLEILAQN